MTKFMTNNRTDAGKTDVNLLSRMYAFQSRSSSLRCHASSNIVATEESLCRLSDPECSVIPGLPACERAPNEGGKKIRRAK